MFVMPVSFLCVVACDNIWGGVGCPCLRISIYRCSDFGTFGYISVRASDKIIAIYYRLIKGGCPCLRIYTVGVRISERSVTFRFV